MFSLRRVQKSIFGEISFILIPAFMRVCMLSTSLSHCSQIILFHSWCKNSSCSALFDVFITLQRFSMGFRSKGQAGHDRLLMWWSSIHTLVDRAVWHGALSHFFYFLKRTIQRGKQVLLQDNFVWLLGGFSQVLDEFAPIQPSPPSQS